jgi:L-gulonate 3-dehydrogenase
MAEVAIIGTGFIGRAWAIAHARAGNGVRLWDPDPEAVSRAKVYIAEILPDLAANDLLNGNQPDVVLSRISPVSALPEAVAGVSYVQENTPERLDVKREVFSQLDTVVPRDAVIASSTSGLLPSTFTGHVAGRDRCIVAHPINPPYLVPATEVVPAPWTTPATVDRTASVLRGIGNAPILIEREIEGFVMNRLQGALLQEAFRLVADGYASMEAVDIGIRDGLGLRWSFMGPFETIDLNAPGGVRDYVGRFEALYADICSTARRVDWAGPVLEEIERTRRAAVPAERLLARQEWRDRRLMALIAHKRQAGRDIGA